MTPDHIKDALNRGSEDVTVERVIQFETDVNIDALFDTCAVTVPKWRAIRLPWPHRPRAIFASRRQPIGQPFGNSLPRTLRPSRRPS
jgi:hypothetical protein